MKINDSTLNGKERNEGYRDLVRVHWLFPASMPGQAQKSPLCTP